MALFEITGSFGKDCRYSLVFDDVKRELVKMTSENMSDRKLLFEITSPIKISNTVGAKAAPSELMIPSESKISYTPETIAKGRTEIVFPAGIQMRIYRGV